MWNAEFGMRNDGTGEAGKRSIGEPGKRRNGEEVQRGGGAREKRGNEESESRGIGVWEWAGVGVWEARGGAYASPKQAIRRFDVFAEYHRLERIQHGILAGEAKGYGLWLAKVVAARKFAR
jgi:hypothetical protein